MTQAYADEVGADAYTPDAGAAAVKAAELVGAEKMGGVPGRRGSIPWI